jgi:hypothetical protein
MVPAARTSRLERRRLLSSSFNCRAKYLLTVLVVIVLA